MTTLTPQAWEQVRAAYENSETPVEDICVAYGISSTTLRHRMRRWGWTRRRPPVPREAPAISVIPGRGFFVASPESTAPALRRLDSGPSAVAASRNDDEIEVHPTPLRLADANRSDPPPPGEGESERAAPLTVANLGTQLQSAVARVLPAIEAIIARLAAGAGAREMEQAGRALSSLTRTLRELNALLAQHNAAGATTRCRDCADLPEDMDAFRNELARRINAFVASRQGDIALADGPGTGDGEANAGET